MRRGTLPFLLLIILLGLGAAYVVFWPSAGKDGKPFLGIPNNFTIRKGLDLQGGIRVLLQANPGQDTSDAVMQAARTQIEQRVNSGLAVNEPSIRVQSTGGIPSIAVELPGFNSGNEQQAINTLLKTGKLEFWDTGSTSVPQNSQFNPSQFTSTNPGGKPLFTGADLDPNSLSVGQDQQ
ncbi:MAG TPA: hypothetical protein VGU68_14840, partial [Ktedonobacteraceae bacterium]|nr:hypothetical protein [Ktedonobacteraceae bacterium]